MKQVAFATFTSMMLLTTGCNEPKSSSAAPAASDERDVNIAETNWYNESAIDNAIITQHTLYPYHFVPDAPSANELGDHDLLVLIEHYKSHPGKLNVRRGNTSTELYQARVNFVVERMFNAGVRLGPIEDGFPGGEGMSSERVLVVLQRSYAAQESTGGQQTSGSSGGMSTMTSGSKGSNP